MGPDEAIELRPVAFVASSRADAVDDAWDDERTTITLADGFGPEALVGLDDFSHVEVLYVFDQADPAKVTTGARRPRSNPAWPEVGIFAQRAKDRPNHLGATICEVVAVVGRTLEVRGLDAVDGTPVVDLKPYMAEFGPRSAVRQPAWSRELMQGYF